ncbi:MAG TPA: SMP-30/gluconolactonase/LRE family protein [Candidatus Limnocylindrales bacterium]|nr:SMP-30/gluconolactonase/LRE family protein [Candidatus Limnocylindrales bacterium]
MTDAIACTTQQTLLGEGPRWDARRNELLRVDIMAGRVFRDRIAANGDLDPVMTYDVPGTVGAVAPIEGDGGWLLAADRGFTHLAPDGSLRAIADVAPNGARMNDAACDPQGRFWAGSKVDRAGDAVLYRLERDGRVEPMLDGLTISNGLGWSPDGRTMYLADSGPRIIHAFDFDGERGTITNGRVLVALADEAGAPDGLTVDADGNLWVAVWGAGQVHRYAPDGELRQVLSVPAAQTTSCAFGGPGLHILYVTTATEDWSDEQRLADPKAGIVYRIETEASGRPAEPFRPDPGWWATSSTGSLTTR